MGVLAYHTPNMRGYKAGGAITAHTFVKCGTVEGTVVQAGAGEAAIGIYMGDEDAASGDRVDVAMPGGGAKLKLAGTITEGGYIKSDSAGKGVANSTPGDYACAFLDSVGTDSTSADLAPVFVLGPVRLAADQGAAVADLTEDGGAVGGTNDGDMPDLTATAATVAGTLTGTVDGTLADVAAIALSTSDTYSDAAVNTAVNTAITATNLQLKELQTVLNAVIADNVALCAGLRETAAKVVELQDSLQAAGVIASA